MKLLREFTTSKAPIKYLVLTLTVLVIADGLITEFLVGSGLGREGNPLLRGIVGEWTFMALKVVGAFLCAFLLWDINRRWPVLALVGTSCLVACYGAIVAWNVFVYFIAVV